MYYSHTITSSASWTPLENSRTDKKAHWSTPLNETDVFKGFTFTEDTIYEEGHMIDNREFQPERERRRLLRMNLI